MRKIFLLLCFLFSSHAFSQRLVESMLENKDVFPLVMKAGCASIVYDKHDYTVVNKSVHLFADDVCRVTGKRLSVSDRIRGKNIIIAGTIERNGLIRQLASAGKIDISKLKGGWEQYLLQAIDNPFKGVSKALVIAGSDRRGVAYGIFTLSDIIGVNPWYWWADAPIKHHKSLFVDTPILYSKKPTVKYRGIFLNDEDWGLQPWAAKNFEKERGDIGPRTYAKICELLLRLKANYLCPAMHPVSLPFNAIPENKLVADSFAIVMGSTHCEPLLLNTAKEWDKKTMGPWDYDKNKDGILKVLDRRVKNNAPYENVWTLALRGLHDAAMGVGVPMKEKVKLLQDALMDQRQLLANNIHKPIEEIPQAFTPYKEVLDIYLHGLELPEDITIIWPDDNFGYMKQVSNPTEQKRKGGSGVYYHVSYLGVPHSYLWFSTTPTALMYEELSKVYNTGGDRIWLVNCGDLKGCEQQVSFFLDLAFDFNRFNERNAYLYPSEWLAHIFGNEYKKQFRDLTVNLTKLAFPRKPEYMGFGYWYNTWRLGERRTDTEFSFENYNEATDRLAEYSSLADEADDLLHNVPKSMKDAMFQLVYYPAKGAELMNRMTMGGQLFRKYLCQKRSETNLLKKKVESLHDSLLFITDEYNSLHNGKWKYMMSLRQNYDGTASYFLTPEMGGSYTPATGSIMAVEVENGNAHPTISAYKEIPMFNVYVPRKHWINIYNQGNKAINWKATASAPWLKLSARHGRTLYGDTLWVDVDWNKAPKGKSIKGSIVLQNEDQQETLLVSVFNPEKLEYEAVAGAFIEDNGYISIPAASFSRKVENNGIKMKVIPGIGICENKVLQIGRPEQALLNYKNPDMPRVDYDFYTFTSGMVDVYTYVLPTFPLHSERDFKIPENSNVDTKYSVCIDGGSAATPSTSSNEYTNTWYYSVLRNFRVNKSTLFVDKPGPHVLTMRIGDPGLVFQKIVIDCGGLKRSYIGPKSSQVKKF